VAVPVTNYQPIKAHLPAQNIRQQVSIAVHLAAVDRVEAGHNRFNTRRNGGGVGAAMDIEQCSDLSVHITLIDALLCAAITKEMLCRRNDSAVAQVSILARNALLPLNQCGAQLRDQIGILRVAFVCAAPAIIARHRHRR